MPKYTVHTYYDRDVDQPMIKYVSAYLRDVSRVFLDNVAEHRSYEVEETSGAAAKREAKRRRVADEKVAQHARQVKAAMQCDDKLQHEYVLELVGEDGAHTFMRNPTLRGWTEYRSEAHRFTSLDEATAHIGPSDAKVVPIIQGIVVNERGLDEAARVAAMDRTDENPEESP